MKSIYNTVLFAGLFLFASMAFATGATLTGSIMNKYATGQFPGGINGWTPVNQVYTSMAKCEAAKTALKDEIYQTNTLISNTNYVKVTMLSCSPK